MTSLYKYTLEMQMLNASLVVKLKFHLKQAHTPLPYLILDGRTMLEGTLKRNRPNAAALLDLLLLLFP